MRCLEMPWKKEDFPRARLEEKLPVVLAPDEVQRFFDHVGGLKHRAVLFTCYGAGLRISEAVAVKLSDIDSRRMLLRVEHGKGSPAAACRRITTGGFGDAANSCCRSKSSAPASGAWRWTF